MADDDDVLCDDEFDAQLEGTSIKDAGALCLLTSVCFLGSDRSRLHVFTLSWEIDSNESPTATHAFAAFARGWEVRDALRVLHSEVSAHLTPKCVDRRHDVPRRWCVMWAHFADLALRGIRLRVNLSRILFTLVSMPSSSFASHLWTMHAVCQRAASCSESSRAGRYNHFPTFNFRSIECVRTVQVLFPRPLATLSFSSLLFCCCVFMPLHCVAIVFDLFIRVTLCTCNLYGFGGNCIGYASTIHWCGCFSSVNALNKVTIVAMQYLSCMAFIR